jgi:hypothetical protein
LFVGIKDGPAYWEWNFSPSGRTNFFAFRAYREHAPAATLAPPRMEWSQVPGESLVAQVELSFAGDATLAHAGTRRAGLVAAFTAVLRDQDGRQSYWATAHARERPDFHAAANFNLNLFR